MRAHKLSHCAGILAVVIAVAVGRALAHGDVTPQPVDTTGLEPLGDGWRDTNPYRGNPVALKIGLLWIQPELRALPRLAGCLRGPGAGPTLPRQSRGRRQVVSQPDSARL